jgi:hypothetical protein
MRNFCNYYHISGNLHIQNLSWPSLYDLSIIYRYYKNTTAATTNKVIAAVVIICRYYYM